MKVCQAFNGHRLENEYDLLIKHQERCGCTLLPLPQPGSFMTIENHFPTLVGFIMTPVGERSVTKEDALRNKNSFTSVLLSLFKLHTHEGFAIIHNDARLPNLLIKSDFLFWVNLETIVTVLGDMAYHVIWKL